jgi:hypothetical protein
LWLQACRRADNVRGQENYTDDNANDKQACGLLYAEMFAARAITYEQREQNTCDNDENEFE